MEIEYIVESTIEEINGIGSRNWNVEMEIPQSETWSELESRIYNQIMNQEPIIWDLRYMIAHIRSKIFNIWSWILDSQWNIEELRSKIYKEI